MLRWFLAGLTVVLISVSVVALGFASTRLEGAMQKTTIFIDGIPFALDTYFNQGYHYAKPGDVAEAVYGAEKPLEIPVGQDASQYYKLREIAQGLNLGISWNGADKTIHIYTSGLSDEEVQQTVHDAYIYALPLVIMDLTIRNLTNISDSSSRPINQFSHARTPATADDKFVVRPNIDTPYSSACLDLSIEPLVFSKPETDRYCSVAIFDAYTNCAAILGTGGLDNGKEAVYLLCGPEYSGAVPNGLVKVTIPTNMAWMLVRTEFMDENDLPNVHMIQDKLSLVPLSQFGNPDYKPPEGSYDPENDFVPLDKIKAMDIETFFDAFNILSESNPGTIDDAPALQSFAKLGIGPGLDFNLEEFSEQTRQELEGYPNSIISGFVEDVDGNNSKFFHIVNNWQYSKDNIARFGTDYEFRALVALTGLGANPVEMAVYPTANVDAENVLLNGENSYVMRFDKNQLPPCDAFWSITAYDADGFLIHNALNKYALRDKDGFVISDDGSVEIYIQSESPGKDLETNWIPVQSGYFQLTLRIYLPDETVMDFSWKPPYIVKVE